MPIPRLKRRSSDNQGSIQISLKVIQGRRGVVQYRFADFELEPSLGELRHGGQPIALEPQVFHLLTHLVTNRDRMVSKDELIETIWEGRIVSDSTLSSRINSLRRVLGDDGQSQAFIRTISRMGYRFVGEVEEVTEAAVAPSPAAQASTMQKPSIAVLPFQNLSGDPDQEYFADGLTEDIITNLTLWRAFPVIARNSTFAYKGHAPDVRKVATELGARYVLEGSVRKSGNRVRVTGQLIDATTGHHVWAERYDRNLDDIFVLQDEISDRIAAIIVPVAEREERLRIISRPPSDLMAWEYWLRGYAYIYEGTPETNEKAREMFHRAIDLDPYYARAYTGLAYTYIKDYRYFGVQTEECVRLMFGAARRAVALDDSDSEARTMLARGYLMTGQFYEAATEARRGVELNPHHPFSNNVLGAVLAHAGQFSEAIPWIERALRLNPLDPQYHLFVTHLALAHLGAGRYPKAIELARDAIRRKPDFIEPHVLLASALGYEDRPEEATHALEPFKSRAWAFVSKHPIFASVTKQCILDGLRRAGLSN